MTPVTDLYLVAALAGAACALAGVYLVLRRVAMIADAISHSILPGLVAGYAFAQGPNLLAAFAGAVAAGILTVVLVEALAKARIAREDSAIGLVFPTLFAVGVLWVSVGYADVHLDTDAVLFGEITLTPFDRLAIAGQDLGPLAAWLLVLSLLATAVFLASSAKQLKAATFDPALATIAGLAPVAVHYGLMATTAVATVASFTAVGAVLAVALVITPAAIARLFARSVPAVLALALAIGTATAILGTAVAIALDGSVSGWIALLLGLAFAAAALLAPKTGALAIRARRTRQKTAHAVEALLIHLQTHDGTEQEAAENQIPHLVAELGWTPAWAKKVARAAEKQGWLTTASEGLKVTPAGQQALVDGRVASAP